MDQTKDTSNPSHKSTWIFFLPFMYLFFAFLLGVLLLGKEIFNYESTDSHQTFFIQFLKIAFSSFLYLLISGIGFLIVTVYTIYRLIRNQSFFLAIQRHWPILLAILYLFIPNLPGPVDDFIVSSLLSALAVYFGFSKKEKKLEKNS